MLKPQATSYWLVYVLSEQLTSPIMRQYLINVHVLIEADYLINISILLYNKRVQVGNVFVCLSLIHWWFRAQVNLPMKQNFTIANFHAIHCFIVLLFCCFIHGILNIPKHASKIFVLQKKSRTCNKWSTIQWTYQQLIL